MSPNPRVSTGAESGEESSPQGTAGTVASDA
jgi:hypothetical protein